MGGDDFREAASDLREFTERMRRNVDNALKREMRALSVVARNYLQQPDGGGPQVWRGALLASIGPTSSPTVPEVIDTSGSYTTHAVEADAPYAGYVEYGTGRKQAGSPRPQANYKSPSVPPLGAIKEWVETKPVVPRSGYGDDPDAATDQLAADIASSIERMGAEAHPFMRPAFHQQSEQITLAHHNAVRSALRRSFTG